MASFAIPLTGLNADSTALNTIANDLSNMNSTAFKTQSTNFANLFYQQLGATGSGDEIQVGAGTQVASNETDFAQGTVSSTGNSTDVALNGSGFFVLSNGGGGYEYTRAGNFTQDTNGNLVTSNGLSVVGYPAVNGVVDTNAPLAAINIPVGQVQAPEATTSFSVTTNLDSAAAVGTSFPAPITVYDSQGVAYPATVNFTKTGTNTWSYNIAVPDTLTAASTPAAATTMAVPSTTPAAANVTVPLTASTQATPFTATLTPATSTSGGNTTYSYNFGTGGTVDGTATLSIGGSAVAIPGAGESVAALEGQINALGVAGVSAALSGSSLSITAPTATALTGSMVGDLAGTTNSFVFNTGGTVDPLSNLTITGQTATGASASTEVPTLASGESLVNYAAALTGALSNANIANVTVSASGNTLSIVGADVTTGGSASEDLAGTTANYNFGSAATVDPATSFNITGQTAAGASAAIVTPTVTAGETVGQYAAALNTALATAGIVGVSASSSGGQLTITGANMTTTGSMSQDLTAASASYTFGSSGGTLATVDPTTGLTISGLTSTGATATITAPTVTAGETIGAYAADLQSAVDTAGIAGVTVSNNAGVLTVTGANVTTTGSVVQDAVGSANASGSLTFNSSGDLVSPAANVNNITFGGLSDGTAALDMDWNLLGANGAANVSQVDSASAVSAEDINGYAPGQYQSFAVGSDGTVSVSYSNGQTANVGQLALANMTNLQGLSLLGDGDYAATEASGPAVVGTSGTAGLGAMQDDALEASNVNISTEFSDLIVAQRAFEANAKSVTSFDQVEQDTINMVH
ncbi:MAG: flagellar hook-basal body complex protein [Terracidiphilus sp.]